MLLISATSTSISMMSLIIQLLIVITSVESQSGFDDPEGAGEGLGNDGGPHGNPHSYERVGLRGVKIVPLLSLRVHVEEDTVGETASQNVHQTPSIQ